MSDYFDDAPYPSAYDVGPTAAPTAAEAPVAQAPKKSSAVKWAVIALVVVLVLLLVAWAFSPSEDDTRAEGYSCGSTGCIFGNGPYPTKDACTKACAIAPTPDRYACAQGTCTVDATGPYRSLASCQEHCGETATAPTACENDACVAKTGGPYPNAKACAENCGVAPEPDRWACVGGTCAVQANGPFENQARCKEACGKPAARWDCGTGGCVEGTQYATHAECNAACAAKQTFACGTDGTCLVSASGPHETLSACQAACKPTVTGYKCQTAGGLPTGACVPSDDKDAFETKAECLEACPLCNADGSTGFDPDTGRCICQPGVQGTACNACAAGRGPLFPCCFLQQDEEVECRTEVYSSTGSEQREDRRFCGTETAGCFAAPTFNTKTYNASGGNRKGCQYYVGTGLDPDYPRGATFAYRAGEGDDAYSKRFRSALEYGAIEPGKTWCHPCGEVYVKEANYNRIPHSHDCVADGQISCELGGARVRVTGSGITGRSYVVDRAYTCPFGDDTCDCNKGGANCKGDLLGQC